MRLGALLLAAGCAAPAPRADRCEAGREPGPVAREVGAELVAGGWSEVVVEPHPTEAGRFLVRARKGPRALAGKVVAGEPGCAGAQVDVRELEVPDGLGRRLGGPAGVVTSHRR